MQDILIYLLALSSATFHSRLKTELFRLSYLDSITAPPHAHHHHHRLACMISSAWPPRTLTWHPNGQSSLAVLRTWFDIAPVTKLVSPCAFVWHWEISKIYINNIHLHNTMAYLPGTKMVGHSVAVIVIVISKLLKRHWKAKRRAPAYSRALFNSSMKYLIL
jgi:hypothetical protein